MEKMELDTIDAVDKLDINDQSLWESEQLIFGEKRICKNKFSWKQNF